MTQSCEAITAKHSTFTSDTLNNTIQGAKQNTLIQSQSQLMVSKMDLLQ